MTNQAFIRWSISDNLPIPVLVRLLTKTVASAATSLDGKPDPICKVSSEGYVIDIELD